VKSLYAQRDTGIYPCIEETPRWRGRVYSIAAARLTDGTICEAEIHWFEAHGIGRKDLKVKRVIR